MRLKPISLSLALLATFGVFAQVPTANKANWKLADRFSTESLRPFVYGTNLTPGWINKTDTFWYSWRYQDGVKFWKVDCKAKKRSPLFDSAHMAALLSQALKKPYDSLNLPITTVTFDEKNDNLMRFTADNVRFEYDLSKDALKELGRGREGAPPEGGGNGNFRNRQGRGQGRFGDFHNYSPDKKAYVYAQDRNLFYVEVKDGKDQPPIQLTKDGEKYYSFGSREDIDEQRRQMQQFLDQNQRNQQNQQNQRDQNEKRVHVNATWSKDSKRFFITRTDERKVADLYLVNSLAEPRPT
ncbi:MAG TPA: hypothetical protein VG820_11235, partial [Fimbriimonadaceae bacterium]|nr:hypothetical protein [Fimbriimonadaceae bacterium]